MSAAAAVAAHILSMTTSQHPVNRDLGRPGHPTQFTERDRPEADTALSVAAPADVPVVFGKRPTGEIGAWRIVTDATNPLATSDQMQADNTLVYRRLPGDAQAIAHRNAVAAHAFNAYERELANKTVVDWATSKKGHQLTLIVQQRDGDLVLREGLARHSRHDQKVVAPKGSVYAADLISRMDVVAVADGYGHVDELLAEFNTRAAKLPLSWFAADGTLAAMPDSEVADVNSMLAHDLGTALPADVLNDILGSDLETRMLAADWGWTDSEVCGTVLSAVSRKLTGQALPTYGEIEIDRELDGFADHVADLARAEYGTKS
jgi:hypothetical protein